jgi:hypothetical protein
MRRRFVVEELVEYDLSHDFGRCVRHDGVVGGVRPHS